MNRKNTVPDAILHKNTVWNGVLARGLVCGLVALTLGLVACNTRGISREFTDDEVNDIGSSVTNEVGASTDSMSLSDVITGGGVEPIAPAAIAPVAGPCASFNVPPSILNPDNTPKDTDGDGVPDLLSLSYDAVNCTRTFFGGSRTLSGLVQVEDPQPSVKNGSYEETLQNFTRTTVLLGKTTTETRNGTRSLINSGNTSLTKTHDLTLDLNLPGRAFDLYVRNAMQLSFTARVPGTVNLKRPLPAGTLVATGSTEWARASQPRRGFSVATTSVISYDPSCEQPLVDGELVLTRPSGVRISILFKPCGTPPVFTELP